MEERYQRETFDLEENHWWYRARREIILAQLRRQFADRPAKDLRILDIGCGAGTILRRLKELGTAVGLDANEAAARTARERAGCQVYVGYLPDGLPEGLDPFHAVGLFDVIEHLDDDVACLRAAREVVADDGVLVVTVPALPWLFGIHDEYNEHRRRYTAGSLRRALREAGFGRVRVSYFNFLLSPMLVPAILWRNMRRSGHNFEVRTALDPLLEHVFGLEKHVVSRLPLPFGLSLIAVAHKQSEREMARVSTWRAGE